jgi:lysophospholipase L1-like esterase
MRVLVFGDSIAQGFWDNEGGWVNRLRKFYDKQMIGGEDNDPPTIFNLGVSGNSSEDIVMRFENEVKARNNDGWTTIVIAVGVNDARTKAGKNFTDIAKYIENLGELLKMAIELAGSVLFVGLTPCVEERSNPVSWGDTSYTNERIMEFDKALQDFCKQHNAPFVNIFEPFSEQQQKTELLPDGLHPNNAGHELIYQLVKPKLEEQLTDWKRVVKNEQN